MKNHLAPLFVGHGIRAGALSIFPVWIDGPTTPNLSWSPTRLRVCEQPTGPVVEALSATNVSERPTVGLAGDLLAGGWQNRMLAASLVFAPRETRAVETLCVEQRRWRGAGEHQCTGRRTSPSVLVRSTRGTSRQSQVWSRIEEFERTLGATVTSSLLDHLDRADRTIRDLMPRPLEGQRGLIFGVGGHVMGAELFGSARGLAKRWDGILDGLALDGRLAPPVATRSAAARAFARRLGVLRFSAGGSAGLARQVAAINGPVRARGIALTTGAVEAMVHATVFDESHPSLGVH